MIETKELITEDRQHINYTHYKGGHSKLVLIAPGFFNSGEGILLKNLAEELFKEYDVAIIDFRGHGKSKGLFCWTAKEYIDLQGLLKELRGKYQKVGLIGFSLGAATSIILTSKNEPIDSLITVSAPVAFHKIDFYFWQLDFENDIIFNLGKGGIGKGVRPGPFWTKKEKPINVIEKISCPVLLIHGEADWLIKPWHSKALYDKVTGKKKIAMIQNGPHAEYLIRKNFEETMRLIKDWFKDTL